MIYISHLDLADVFLRAFRMTNMKPVYSNGFNPHPKMSFAMPLSLGFYSFSELLEFETDAAVDLNTAPSELNGHLPDGLRVDAIFVKPEKYKKTLASYAKAAKYEIICDEIYDATARLNAYYAQKEILQVKHSRKKGTDKTIDIKPLILDLAVDKEFKNKVIMFVTLSATADGRVLNPTDFLRSFYEYCGVDFALAAPTITRLDIILE
jgi:radical SAM-linked protein